MKNKILIIDGHPNSKSLCASFVSSYKKGAEEAKNSVDVIKIRNLKFNPILKSGTDSHKLEKDLIDAQKKIKGANHLVFVAPVWWGNFPALTKGFLDRTFICGFSHKFNKQTKAPEGLLSGRSASVIYTQGSPKIYTKIFLFDAFWKTLKIGIFGFCGFSPVKRKYYGNINGINKDKINATIKEVFELGKKGF